MSESHKKLCTVDKVVLVELVRDNELSGPEELAGAAALLALSYLEGVAGRAKKNSSKVEGAGGGIPLPF